MIEVGEYVRNEIGEIAKIIDKSNDIDVGWFMFEGNYDVWYKPDKVLSTAKSIKHSKNIIDLIEVGDYVNGNLIIEEYIDIKDDEENFIGMCVKKGIQVDRDEYDWGGCIDIGDYFYFKPLENIKIKTILTHELHEQNCYRVVE